MTVYPLNPGPSWNVPRVQAPGCLGLLPQYEIEWWYYTGVVEAGDERFSVQVSVDRLGAGPLGLSFGLLALGRGLDDSYRISVGYGVGVWDDVPDPIGLSLATVNDDTFALSFSPVVGDTRVRVRYTGGTPVGTIGSTYLLEASGADPSGSFAITVPLTDRRGLVLEGISGYVGPGTPGTGPVGHGAATYEFAQPRLEIGSGSLTLGERTYELTGGMLWLDRQVMTNSDVAASRPPVDPARPDLAIEQQELYRGDWMGIMLDGGVTLVLATFWQPPCPPAFPLQWITGTLVGRPPLGGFGTVYAPTDPAALNGGYGLLGARVDSTSFDFDMNVLDYAHPAESPHWMSPNSKKTYCTAWAIRFDKRVQAMGVPGEIFVRAVTSGCENAVAGQSFWEGGAVVYADSACERRIGVAAVEQMGFD
ncbi:MAG TPA: hypothetical protein VK665_02735 [Candidatus Elarobacter sp.]|nr:hypothetical protein [Candidatus Elarobacter sp.]